MFFFAKQESSSRQNLFDLLHSQLKMFLKAGRTWTWWLLLGLFAGLGWFFLEKNTVGWLKSTSRLIEKCSYHFLAGQIRHRITISGTNSRSRANQTQDDKIRQQWGNWHQCLPQRQKSFSPFSLAAKHHAIITSIHNKQMSTASCKASCHHHHIHPQQTDEYC